MPAATTIPPRASLDKTIGAPRIARDNPAIARNLGAVIPENDYTRYGSQAGAPAGETMLKAPLGRVPEGVSRTCG